MQHVSVCGHKLDETFSSGEFTGGTDVFPVSVFFLTARSQRAVSCVSRPAHDISLEEFDDEDLSEITDDCGIGLNYDSDPYEKVSPSFVVMWFLILKFGRSLHVL